MRRAAATIVLASAAALTAATLPAQAASPIDPDQADSYGSVRNILPPGQRGTITALDLVKVLAGDPIDRIAKDGKNAPKKIGRAHV